MKYLALLSEKKLITKNLANMGYHLLLIGTSGTKITHFMNGAKKTNIQL